MHTKKIIKGIKSEFNLYPENIVEQLEVGDILSIDFNSAILQVSKKNNTSTLQLRVLVAGVIGSNKAVTVNRSISLKFITHKDLSSIELGLTKDVNHFALSFANNSKDVRDFREIVGKDSFLIAKIESAKGLLNKEDIIRKAEKIGTYKISIEPYDDCCSFFVPIHPETKADLETVRQTEDKIKFNDMFTIALNNADIINIEHPDYIKQSTKKLEKVND